MPLATKKPKPAALADNPGLRPRAGEALERAYRTARIEAIRETGLRQAEFAETCPFTPAEVLNRPYSLD